MLQASPMARIFAVIFVALLATLALAHTGDWAADRGAHPALLDRRRRHPGAGVAARAPVTRTRLLRGARANPSLTTSPIRGPLFTPGKTRPAYGSAQSAHSRRSGWG